jgi:hypothetical protein
MNLFRAMFARIAAEVREQWFGRCALREVSFRKYKVAAHQENRVVEERLLRKVPRSFKRVRLRSLTS